MFCSRKISWVVGACLFLAIVIWTAPAFAETQTVKVSPNLYFKLGDDQAYVVSTRGPGLEYRATLPFSFMWDTAATVEYTELQFRVTYDATLLDFDAAGITANWSGSIDVADMIVDDTLGVVTVTLSEDTEEAPDEYTEMAWVRFKAWCQDEMNVDDVKLVQDPYLSYVEVGSDDYSPQSGNWDDGTVTIVDYIAEAYLPDLEVSTGVGTVVTVPLRGTCNYFSGLLDMYIMYDDDMLDFDSIVYNPNIYSHQVVTVISDSVVECNLWNSYGTPEFEDTAFAWAYFDVLCDLSESQTPLRFVQDDCSWPVVSSAYCDSLDDIGQDFTDTGSISVTNSAALKAEFSSDTLVSTYVEGDSVAMVVFSTNSFAAGADNVVSDTGIVMNFSLGDHFRYLSDTGLVHFENLEAHGRTMLSMWQDLTGQWDTASTFTERDLIRFEWVPGDLEPTWEDRFVAGPAFVSDFDVAYDPTALPDLEDCIVANVSNGLLELNDPDTLEIAVGQFYAAAMTWNSCPYQDLYVRSNFDLDSFYLQLDVQPVCALSASDFATGVTATQIDDSTIEIRSTGSWTPPGDTDLVKICHLTYRCYGAGQVPTYLRATEAVMFNNAPDDSEFVDTAIGNIIDNNTVRCVQPPGVPRISGNPEPGLPAQYALHQNYPNPFNPSTVISFDVPHPCDWKLTIFNIAGQAIKESAGSASAGTVEVTWDASEFASGVYLYRLEAGDFSMTRKMLMIK